MKKLLILFLLTASPCLAANSSEEARRMQAIPSLVEQRNSALDGLAFCAGDLQALKKENADLKAELDKLKPPSEGDKK